MMRKRIFSMMMACALVITAAPSGHTTRVLAKTETEAGVKPAYCWDFENVSDGKFSSSGTENSEKAVLKGTATTAEDTICIGDKNYKEAGNSVLVLSGGSKGSSYVELPSSLYEGVTANTGFSYSFWMKPDSAVGSYSRVISSTDSSSSNEFAFAPYAADKVWNVLFDNTNTVYAPMAAEPEKNLWSFVTVSVSAEEVTFYVNGAESGTVSNSGNLSKRLNSMSTLVNNALGRTCSTWSDPDAKVKLDDVCLYKTALTEEEAVNLAKAQGIEIREVKEAGGANELTDGTAVTDTGITIEKGDVSAKIVEDKATGRYFITASKGGEVVLDASALGAETSSDFTKNLTYVENSKKTDSGKDEYTLSTGANREICDEYEELSFQLKSNDTGKIMTVIVRAYDEGISWRYQWEGTAGEKETIKGEASEFVLPSNSSIWAGYDNAGNYEYEYQKMKMSSVKAATAKYSVPLLASSGDKWLLLTEASVFSEKDTYCASHLSTSAGTRNLKFAFGKGSSNSISMTYNEDGIVHTPWRVAVLANNLNDIVNSSMTYSLNPKADETLFEDRASWVKTGTVAWSWWSEAGDDPIEFDQQKDYIDFAAQNGWEYVCLDFGWCLWEDYRAKVKELVEYGNEKNVGILLWYGVNNDNHAGFKDAEGKAAYPKYSLRTTAQLEEQFSWCESVGVKGVKVDYYENDDKATMTQMYECATIAAKHKINVLFHGCTAPRGEMKTFPNVLGYEAVRGSEYYKWNVGPSVSNCLTYIYNRNVVGGMDFTPVGTQIDQLPVTAGFQLAQVIAYETGLQNIASSVYKLEGYNGLSMINDVPTRWDETRLLGGYPGKEVRIARRSGEDWYIAAMTAAAKTENLSLDFLGEGTYKAYIYKDNETGTDVVIDTKEVTNQSELELVLAENGGAAVKISKEEMNTHTLYSNYDYYEAESSDNQISGNAAIGKNQFASGMKQVTGLGGTAYNKITFKKIQAPEDGIYEMRLYYACGVKRRVVFSINGEEEIRSCHLNAGVNTLAMQKFYVKLKKGENVISFGNATAKAPNIDRIAISKETVNESATVTDLTEDGGSFVDGTQYDYTLYECGKAVLAGGAVIENGAIGWLGASAGSTATFKVKAEKAGKYKLQINYFAGETRNVHVSVNGGENVICSCPSTGSYTIDSMDSIYVDVQLKEGDNTIKLGNTSAWCPNIVSIGISKTVISEQNDNNGVNPVPSESQNQTISQNQNTNTEATIQPKGILVKAKGYDISKITLLKGKKVTLVTSVLPAKAVQKVSLKSSNTSVATVNAKGVVKGKKPGKVKITILSQDKTKKKVVTISVVAKKKVNRKLVLKNSKVKLKKKGETAQITIKTLTSKTTDCITYKGVSGKKYIKVDKYGKIAVVKSFKGKKNAIIMVRCGKAAKKLKVLLSK